MQRREQLTNIDDLDMSNLHFEKPKTFKIPYSDRTYDCIPIVINYDDATFGSLLLKTDKCFSFGAQHNINKETGEVYGWTLPISMYNREGVTLKQLTLVRKLRDIIKHAKEHVKKEYLIDNDDTLEKLGGCLWQSDDETKGPTLYAKIMTAKNGNTRYDSRFSRVKDLSRPCKKERVTKEEITENCYVIAVIRIDSIYVYEEKAYLQVKVHEANVEKLRDLPSFL